jgi:xanthine dehydrogenase molybdopterin-binding subunit B
MKSAPTALAVLRDPWGRFQSRDRPGNPFLYFTNGAPCREVEIDRLTGGPVTRVDILSISADRSTQRSTAQVIGGFVQGMGWATTEELLYSDTGELLALAEQLQIPASRSRRRRRDGRQVSPSPRSRRGTARHPPRPPGSWT